MKSSLLSKTAPAARTQCHALPQRAFLSSAARQVSSASAQKNAKPQDNKQAKDQHASTGARKIKSVTELDSELRARLEEMSGDGGAAGVEYENGVAEGLRSEVKRNMFRVI
jgi:hypothetical protein